MAKQFTAIEYEERAKKIVKRLRKSRLLRKRLQGRGARNPLI